MTLRVVWEKCAVDNAETGESKILNRGEELPEFVSDFLRSTLTMIGAVKEDGAAVAMAEAARDAEFAEPVGPAIHPAEVPPVQSAPRGTNVDPTATVPVTPNPNGPVPADTTTPTPDAAVKPALSDNKDAWESYAVAKGYMTETEAESMTKAKLVAAVNDREKA